MKSHDSWMRWIGGPAIGAMCACNLVSVAETSGETTSGETTVDSATTIETASVPTESSLDPTQTGPAATETSGPTEAAEASEPTDPAPTTGGVVCGDGVKEGAEGCDDGNTDDDDECKNDCTLPGCGDGLPGPGEECDAGPDNDDSGACLTNCQLAKCGDGFVQAGVETCDDGNDVDDDACSNACAAETCGDGELDDDEACDAGADNSENGACLPSCQVAFCGDGFLHEGVEECDDGDVVDGDGCSVGCELEVCGNGKQEPGEECDDGNTVDTDDCLNACFLAFCGDGVVADQATNPEACDDGNQDNSDACPSSCQAAVCGDGFVFAGNEECDAKGVSNTCDVQCKRTAYWVFATSTKFSGSGVTSLAAADAACTQLAVGRPIEGTYKAWLGDGAATANGRLFHSTVRYILPNSAKVADSWADLTDGTLDAAMSRDESGSPIAINPAPTMCTSANAKDAAVWTGSLPNGSGAMNCAAWSSTAMQGQGGLFTRQDALWSNCLFSCDTQARLYCVEQPAG